MTVSQVVRQLLLAHLHKCALLRRFSCEINHFGSGGELAKRSSSDPAVNIGKILRILHGFVPTN
jgi:hypothetical protein